MEKQLKKLLKTLKINENTISTIMGAAVVLVMGVMIFNYFKSINKGQVTDNGTSSSTEASQTTSESPTSKDLPAKYKVVKGDDLWHISEKFYGSGYNYVDIIKENKLSNPSVITAGTELTIPKVEPKKLTKVAVDNTKVITKVVTKAISIEGNTYKTVKGDHLWNIAVRAYGDGYAWVKIYDANKEKIGNNPSLLYKDIELKLPR